MTTDQKQQSYRAMQLFLRRHWERTCSEDIAALVGDLSSLPDGQSADPAAWSDWVKAIEDASQMDDDEFGLDLPSRNIAG